MGMTMASLLPLMIGAALLPLWIVMTLLLLRSQGGVIKASAFATGAMTIRLAQGILFGYIFSEAADGRGLRKSDLIAPALLLVVGVFLLATVARAWYIGDDPDAPPPKWMRTLSEVSAFTAFGIGAMLMIFSIKQWVFTLSAIAVIDEAELGRKGSVLAFLVFAVAAQSLVLIPVILYATAPAHAARALAAALGWLERNHRAVTIVVSLVLGGWFLWKGMTGMLEVQTQAREVSPGRIDEPVLQLSLRQWTGPAPTSA